MQIAMSDVIRDFLALRGESPELLPLLGEGEDSAVLTLERQLRVRVVQAAIDATLSASRLSPDAFLCISTDIVADSAGCGCIRMPDDFLKFHSLRMADWRQPLTALEPPDSLRACLGANAPSWMICKENPMVVEFRDSTGVFLKVYGSDALSMPAELFYVPAPSLKDGILTIARAAYPGLLQKLDK